MTATRKDGSAPDDGPLSAPGSMPSGTAVRVVCPGCSVVLRIPARLAGQVGKCPRCGNRVQVSATRPAESSSRTGGPAALAAPAAARPSQAAADRPPAQEMEPISFRCPECGEPMKVPASQAGHSVNCRDCGKPVQVPRSNAEAMSSFYYGLAGDAPPQQPAEPQSTEPAEPPQPADVLRFPCPECGEQLKVAVRLAGQPGKCRWCNATIQVPRSQAEAMTGYSYKVTVEPLHDGHCPSCKEGLAPEDILCVNCGYHLKLKQKLPPPVIRSKHQRSLWSRLVGR